MTEKHWSERLITASIPKGPAVVRLPANGETDPGSVLVVLSRIGAIADAMRTPTEGPDVDDLANEDPSDLLRLLDHVHRVRMVLEGFEERVLDVADRRGVSLRTLAATLDVSSPGTISYRLDKIRRAGAQGRTAAAYDEDPMAGNPL